MRNCIDEGTLQSWFDGELASSAAADVGAHVHSCIDCAEAARALEAENAILSQALSAEFSEGIPTERLCHLVEAAVAGLPVGSMPTTNQSWISAVRDLFSSFRVLAYASMAAAILFAGFLLLGYLKKEKPSVAQENARTVNQASTKAWPEPKVQTVASKATTMPASRRLRAIGRNRASKPDATSLSWQEHQYERAIAKLNEAIKSQPPMRPSLRVEYEYNLALIDNAIVSTRDVARRNPKDPQGAKFMQAAYQSKIDLMNQIADAADSRAIDLER